MPVLYRMDGSKSSAAVPGGGRARSAPWRSKRTPALSVSTHHVINFVMRKPYATDSGYTVDAYFKLVDAGVLQADDRVELLDGVIVAEPPMDPPHATGITLVARSLQRAVGDRAAVRIQSPLIADPRSAPE